MSEREQESSMQIEDNRTEGKQHVLAEALAETAAILNRSLDLDEVLDRILEQVGRVVPHEGTNIMLINDEGMARVRRAHAYREERPVSSYLLNHGFDAQEAVTLRTMIETRRALVIADTEALDGWVTPAEKGWVRSYAGAPIIKDDEVIGFLNLDASTPNFFTRMHAERLEAFASHAALALKNAQLYEALAHHSDYLESAVDARTAELQRTMEQMNAIVSYSPQAVMLVNVVGLIEHGNPALETLFGYSATELDTLNVCDLAAHDDVDLLKNAFREALVTGQSRRLQLKARRRGGTVFDADVALAPIVEQGTVNSLICSIHDISGLKEVERMKDAFVSNVSHELRTPISSLKLYHGLLQRDAPRRELYLQRMGREIDRLNVIVEDLLRLSRLEQGRVHLETAAADLHHLVAQHVTDRRPLAEDRDLGLRLDEPLEPAPVFMDKGLMGQVFSILLTNALNYTPSGGQIHVGFCRKVQDEKPYHGFYVSDSGPGIGPEERAHLFERFFRGEAALHSGASGTGLGLSIADEIVARHHGQIEVENGGIGDKGATFRVWLPEATGATDFTRIAEAAA